MPFNTLANTTEGLQEKRARLQQQYEDYVCPISFGLMNNPIKTPCGHYFDQLPLCLEMISARHRGAVQCCPKCRGSLDRFLPSDIDVLKLAEITKLKVAFDLAFPDFTGDFSVYENNRLTLGISERFFNFYSKTSDIFKKIISKDTWKPILILAFGVNRVGDTIVSIEEENLQYMQAKKQVLVGAKNLAINTLEYAIKPTLNATLYATKKMTPFILSNAYNAAEYSVQMTAKGIYWSAPIAA